MSVKNNLKQLHKALECGFAELFDFQEGVSNWKPYVPKEVVLPESVLEQLNQQRTKGMTIHLNFEQAQLLYTAARDYAEADASYMWINKKMEERLLRHDDVAELFDEHERTESSRILYAIVLADFVIQHIMK